MERIGLDWGAILALIVPFVIMLALFFVSKTRLQKIECVMGEIAFLFGFLSYYVAEISTEINMLKAVGVSIAFGVIAAAALMVVGLIEIKRATPEK
ncbi:hypothetical protein [Fluviicola sp.]|uniref:hypothetical protein n=1 Tax=Fluviicola sp. TaxID=1917219 RepID=UPI002622DC7C|nr:hypothetical protein [Fluviicola sp.]